MLSARVLWTALPVAFLLGVLAYVLSPADPNYMTAVATFALAVIAGLTIGREVQAHHRRRDAMEQRLRGVAWLARRSCEVTLRYGVGYISSAFLAQSFTRPRPLDRLEAHFREVLAISSALGGEAAEVGASAFEGFIAAADRFNEIVGPSRSGQNYTQLANEALHFLWAAVDDLETFARREAHEEPLVDSQRLGPYQPPPPAVPPPPPASTPPPPPPTEPEGA